MSVEVALCSGPCRVPLQWPPDLKHLQVDAEIEVAGEKEQNSKEAETEVSTYQIHGFSFSQDHYSFLLFAIISSFRFDLMWKNI